MIRDDNISILPISYKIVFLKFATNNISKTNTLVLNYFVLGGGAPVFETAPVVDSFTDAPYTFHDLAERLTSSFGTTH